MVTIFILKMVIVEKPNGLIRSFDIDQLVENRFDSVEQIYSDIKISEHFYCTWLHSYRVWVAWHYRCNIWSSTGELRVVSLSGENSKHNGKRWSVLRAVKQNWAEGRVNGDNTCSRPFWVGLKWKPGYPLLDIFILLNEGGIHWVWGAPRKRM